MALFGGAGSGSNVGGAIGAVGAGIGALQQGKTTAAEDLLKQKADLAEAQQYALGEQFSKVSTAVQEAQTQRAFFKAQGATEAEVASAGFAASGSALDIMRENAQQGGLSMAMLQEQGLMTQEQFQIQEQYANEAADTESRMAQQAEKNSQVIAGLDFAAAIVNLIPSPAAK